ncbi:MAG: membrane protein insertase YidC, partial [Nitrospirae bacterium]|nr:membrane protein insertase YidC [Nitrospirota bacterium]
MEKRTLLAITLSLVILLVYQYFFVKPAAPPATSGNIAKESVKEGQKQTAAAVAPIQETKASEGERDVVVENDLYTATFSSIGGTIKSILLKQYKDDKGNPIMLTRDEALPPFSIGANQGFQYA